MKSILIVETSFRHGGVNKSLQNLLSVIDPEEYEIDIFCLDHSGPYRTLLSHCKILPRDKKLESMTIHLRELRGISKVTSFSLKLIRRAYTHRGVDWGQTLFRKAIEKYFVQKKYNAVIAFSEGLPTKWVSELSVENKIAWVHCEYSNYLKLNHSLPETDMYDHFTKIVCVSGAATADFARCIPSCRDKVFTIYNSLNNGLIRLASIAEKSVLREDVFSIVSIGRVDAVKRFSEIPLIAAELKARGCVFKWNIIGGSVSAAEWNLIVSRRSAHGVEDCVELLGAIDNPYPYIRESSLLVCLSYSESFNYTVSEAKVLGIPVISTDYPCASEFIDHRMNGYILPIHQMAGQIEELIKNRDEYLRIKKNLSGFTYDNEKIIRNFRQVVSGANQANTIR